jgi:replicative DNA helicase
MRKRRRWLRLQPGGGLSKARDEVVNVREGAHAEMTVLGAMLSEEERVFEAVEELIVPDFILSSHRIIYSAMLALVEDRTPIDYTTLGNELRRRKELESVGGMPYLFSLTEGLPRKLSIESYVRIVKGHAQMRRLGAVLSSGFQRVEDGFESAGEIIADLQNQLIEQSAEGHREAARIGTATEAIRKRLNEGRNSSEERVALGFTWGVKGLDDFTKGLHHAEVTVIGGESGGGKSSAAVQILLENAKEDTPVCVFSLEMGKGSFAERFYPQMSKIITADMMRDPRLLNLHTHIPEIDKLEARMQELPVWIDETSSMHINTLCARIRMMKRKHGIKLFVIDYLQLIVGDGKTEAETIKNNMFKLRDLAKLEGDIHIVVLSQYSKADGFSKKARRTRNDLQGSSSIHQAAQNVVLIKIEDDEGKDPLDLLDAEFKFDKQRAGKKGKVVCSYDRQRLRYRYAEAIPF